MKSLLILDAISGVPLALELKQAFQLDGVDVQYADLMKFRAKNFYQIRAAYRKALNKRENKDSYYHSPKIAEAEFERYITQVRPSHILVVGFLYKFLAPDFLLELSKRYGFSIYLYDTDSCNLYSRRREFVFFVENELPVYNHIFSFSKVITKFFKDTRGLNASFLPFAAKQLAKNDSGRSEIDVLFVGSCDLRRIFLLERICEYVRVYGDRWTRNAALISPALQTRIHDEELWGDALLDALAKSKIVLNITRTQFYGAGTGVNLRVFEALSAGCFVMTDYCEELPELFEIGKEIEVYRSENELREKVVHYLANPDKIRAIAQAGHERFISSHTWEGRVALLKAEMGI